MEGPQKLITIDSTAAPLDWVENVQQQINGEPGAWEARNAKKEGGGTGDCPASTAAQGGCPCYLEDISSCIVHSCIVHSCIVHSCIVHKCDLR